MSNNVNACLKKATTRWFHVEVITWDTFYAFTGITIFKSTADVEHIDSSWILS